MKGLRLKTKTLIVLFTVVFLAAVVSIWYQGYYIKTNFEKQQDSSVENVGTFIMPTVETAMWNFQKELVESTVRNSVVINKLNEIVILDEKGAVHYSVSQKDGKLINENKPQRKGILKKVDVIHTENEEREKIGTIEIYYDYLSIEAVVSRFLRNQIINWAILFSLWLLSSIWFLTGLSPVPSKI